MPFIESNFCIKKNQWNKFSDSSHKLLDMLVEFQPDGMFYKYISEDDQGFQTINFIGFTHFINCYFGAELPADLIQQLFLSFAQGPPLAQSAIAVGLQNVNAVSASAVSPNVGAHVPLEATSTSGSFGSSFSQTSSSINGSTIAPPQKNGIFIFAFKI